MIRGTVAALLATVVWGAWPGLERVARASVDQECDNVIARSAQQATPDQALEVLGACLATPAPLPVLQRVALQMAVVSFQKGDAEWGMRYLEILGEMLQEDPAITDPS